MHMCVCVCVCVCVYVAALLNKCREGHGEASGPAAIT